MRCSRFVPMIFIALVLLLVASACCGGGAAPTHTPTQTPTLTYTPQSTPTPTPEKTPTYVPTYTPPKQTPKPTPTTCLTADTKVLMADGSFKFIAEIKEGEQVQGFDFRINDMINNEVTGLLESDADSYLVINDGLKVTGKHPFAVGHDTWKEAAQLEVGDMVLGKSEIEIRSVKIVMESVQVFNLTVDGTHNYFVSDGKEVFLVHNKGGGI